MGWPATSRTSPSSVRSGGGHSSFSRPSCVARPLSWYWRAAARRARAPGGPSRRSPSSPRSNASCWSSTAALLKIGSRARPPRTPFATWRCARRSFGTTSPPRACNGISPGHVERLVTPRAVWLLLAAGLLLGGGAPAASKPLAGPTPAATATATPPRTQAPTPAPTHAATAPATPSSTEAPLAATTSPPPSPTPVAYGRWSGVATPAGPPSRGDAQMVTLLADGRVLIATGLPGAYGVSETHVFLASPAGDNWVSTPSMQTSRIG